MEPLLKSESNGNTSPTSAYLIFFFLQLKILLKEVTFLAIIQTSSCALLLLSVSVVYFPYSALPQEGLMSQCTMQKLKKKKMKVGNFESKFESKKPVAHVC